MDYEGEFCSKTYFFDRICRRLKVSWQNFVIPRSDRKSVVSLHSVYRAVKQWSLVLKPKISNIVLNVADVPSCFFKKTIKNGQNLRNSEQNIAQRPLDFKKRETFQEQKRGLRHRRNPKFFWVSVTNLQKKNNSFICDSKEGDLRSIWQSIFDDRISSKPLLSRKLEKKRDRLRQDRKF